jgi:hypothetical protein
VYVGLKINGDFLAEDITRRLGLEPATAWTKGTEMPERRPGTVASTSHWATYSDELIEADTIEPHLEWLRPARTSLRSLISDRGGRSGRLRRLHVGFCRS